MTFEYLEKKIETSRGLLDDLVQRGVLEVQLTQGFAAHLAPKKIKVYEKTAKMLQDSPISLALQQKLQTILSLFSEVPSLTKQEIIAKVPETAYALKRAVELGFLQVVTKEIFREAAGLKPPENVEPPNLTNDQQEVLRNILPTIGKEKFRSFLLHGVTGSGKTEVYLQLTQAALDQKLGVIILVPEIALTPQLLQRVRSRFGQQVAVLHSSLSQGERMDQWRSLACGERRIVIGARSAIFAPLENLGLIIVDEEHDPSYKQDDRLPYHGRDLAELRAKHSHAILLLGSATPEVSSYYKTSTTELQLLKMPSRIAGMHQPQVQIVDMRNQPKQFGKPTLISQPLLDALKHTLEKSESVILFLNRRGFTPVLMCSRCGATPKCTHCSVTLTYHRQIDSLVCHYCGFQRSRDQHCQGCGEKSWVDLGMGTERLQEEIQTLFPESRVVRMDRDTTRQQSSHTRMIADLQSGKTDVLVGTQMVTKGLDIDRVTLIGVLSADLSLHVPDFRACERTFQLLTQVAGRTGRGKKPGYVYIQTFNPDHYAIRYACGEDYKAFYQHELELRREANYPPFSRLIALRFSALDELQLKQGLADPLTMQFLSLVSKTVQGELIGPVVAPLQRLYGKFRWHALIKHPIQVQQFEVLRQPLLQLQTHLKARQIEMKWDIDPVSFL
jgi:primosomal protein N' (replication factor Y)